MANDLYAIIPVSGTPPDDAIVVGNLDAVMEYVPQGKAQLSALAALDRARFSADQISKAQADTRGVLASTLADAVAHLASRLDTYTTRHAEEAREAAAREDAAEQERIQAELDALPDPDNPEPSTHENTGALHTLKAKHNPGNPDAEPVTDDQGELPEPGTQDAGEGPEFELPEPPGIAEGPHPRGKASPQPTALEIG